MPTTAATIPPELFQLILQTLTLPEYIATWTENFVRAEKREFARCALVCKYWATLCQERIFRNLTLRSRDDLAQLTAFLHSPLSRVSRYIIDIVVDVDVDTLYRRC